MVTTSGLAGYYLNYPRIQPQRNRLRRNKRSPIAPTKRTLHEASLQ